MKILLALLMLFAVTAESQARTRERVTVHPVQRPIVTHPYAVDYVLSYIFCGFHVFSVGPNPRPGQLGSCADRFNYAQPRRRV
jgi:hypothetical protein